MFPRTFKDETKMVDWAKEHGFGVRKAQVDTGQRGDDQALAKRNLVMAAGDGEERKDERVATYEMNPKNWRLKSHAPANACPYCGKIAVLEPGRKARKGIVIHKKCADAQAERNTQRTRASQARRIG